MSVKLRLTVLQELDLLQYDLARWSELFPYEKQYLLRRSKELALQHEDVLGEHLTKGLLASINSLLISR